MTISLAAATRLSECLATSAKFNGGTLNLYDGIEPDVDLLIPTTHTLLVSYGLPSTVFLSPVDNGTTCQVQTGTPPSATALATGQASYFRVLDSAGVTVLQGNISLTGGGGDITMDTLAVVVGDSMAISGFSFIKNKI